MKTLLLITLILLSSFSFKNDAHAESASPLLVDVSIVTAKRDVALNEIYGYRVTDDVLRQQRAQLIKASNDFEKVLLEANTIEAVAADAS